MDDLVTWLRAQLDDEERSVEDDVLPSGEASWVRANVDAKRRILAEHLKDEYRDECRRCFDPDTAPGDYDFETFPCPTLRALALPYADRPGYRFEWVPA